MSQLVRAPYVYKEALYVKTLLVCDHVSQCVLFYSAIPKARILNVLYHKNSTFWQK